MRNSTRNMLIIMLIVVVGIGCSLLFCQAPIPRPRFEHILSERHESEESFIDVWHDKETGQETVCIYGKLAAPSCYLTGRKW